MGTLQRTLHLGAMWCVGCAVAAWPATSSRIMYIASARLKQTVKGSAAVSACSVCLLDLLLLRKPAVWLLYCHHDICRAGHKMEAALDHFQLDVAGLTCLDAGLSTGGFTDCLLQRGATKVYGVDVGFGQVHLIFKAMSWKSDKHIACTNWTCSLDCQKSSARLLTCIWR